MASGESGGMCQRPDHLTIDQDLKIGHAVFQKI
jgi:hypothetical protein